MDSEYKYGTDAAVISAALEMMWARFLPDLRDRVQVLEEAAQRLAEGGLADILRRNAQGAAHKLAGSLGTFGLARGTELARGLEARYAQGGLQQAEAAGLAQAAAEIRALVEGRKRM